jgi:GNAT superfamily N-acetyltransferase
MARRAIVATLAADAACDEADLAGDGITVVESREMPGRRRFDRSPKPFQVFTVGRGVVVSCHRDWLEWSRERARSLDRGQFLAPPNIAAIVALLAGDGYTLIGPHVSLACSSDTLRTAPSPAGLVLDTVEGHAIEALRPFGAFRNALPARANPLRPDMLAVTASAGGEVVACAAASDENGTIWQIGVDVLAPWRGRGIGRAVVSRLTEAILIAGMVPYYSHSVSNVPSATLATSLGFWPAWTQRHALEHR